MTASRPALLALSLLLVTTAPACVLTPELIGETLTEGGDSAATISASTELTVTTLTGATDIGATTESIANPNPLLYGQPCELIAEAWEETADPPDGDEVLQPQATALSSSERCASGMCLLTYDDPLPVDCETHADCGKPEAVCSDAGQCMLAPAYVADHTRCTQACETAADCPDIPGCQTGVSCAIASRLGENCCQPVCACNDHLSVSRSEELAAICAANPPGCD
ncbi:hypothetical protein [Nannocystis pusilla]|uniref:Uncharacterized protein n=1 Tax=Nannocystis pusilla TaxID=889268 RepID=A0ABS7U1B0_9BACT|nr:hypothetical protein [Nannocystis pusilla]MBZ5714206.1 hypothetical protein [Nannocystis pusilla]